MLTLILLPIPLGSWVVLGDPLAQLQAALQQHDSALAYFSCRVEYENGGYTGQGFYVRTPDSTRMRFDGAGSSSDILKREHEIWTLSYGRHGTGARRVGPGTFVYNMGNPWGHTLLVTTTPELHILELAKALPLLPKEKVRCEHGADGEEILLTVTYDNFVHQYTFGRRFGYLPTKVTSNSRYRETSTTTTLSVMSDFEELAPGVYFARRADYHTASSSTSIPENNKVSRGFARLTNLSLDPKAGEKYPKFHIPEGTPIRDEIDREYYQLDAAGKRVPVMKDGRVMKAAWEQDRDEAKYLDQRQAARLADASALGPTGFNEPSTWPWVLGGSTLGIFVAAVVYFLRRRWLAAE